MRKPRFPDRRGKMRYGIRCAQVFAFCLLHLSRSGAIGTRKVDRTAKARHHRLPSVMTTLSFVLIACVSPSPAQAASSLLASGAYGGRIYEIRKFSSGVPWPTAKAEAESLGGHLATVTSQAENSFLRDLAAPFGDESDQLYAMYLGGYKDEINQWRWVTSETFSFINWATGEPNNANGGENALTMYISELEASKPVGSWNDVGLPVWTLFAVERVAGVEDGLIAHYSFDSTPTADSSGNGHTGAIVGTGLTTIPGIHGNALHFSGSGYIEVPGAQFGVTTSRDRTAAMWFRVASKPPHPGVLISKYTGFNPGNSNFYASVWQDPNLPPYTAMTANGTNTRASYNLVFGTWQHVTFVWSGTAGLGRIYTNGVLSSEGPLAYSSVVSTQPLRIGTVLNQGDQAYIGDMDELRIYDRALTAAEVATLANGATEGPIAWYSFDVSGQPGKDVVGGHNATQVVGATQPAGKVGLAVSLSNGYLLLPQAPAFNLRAADFTLSAWMKSQPGSGNRHWFTKATALTHQYGLGTVNFGFDGGAGGLAVSVTNPIDGTWHHVAGVKRGATAEIWVDGNLEASSAINGSSDDGIFAIGRDGGCCEFFNGLLDEAKIWDRALSPAELQIEAQQSCTRPAAPLISSNGPVCIGQSLQLRASSIPGATYHWTGPGWQSSQQNPQIPNVGVGNTGMYSVTATLAGCTSAPAATAVEVLACPAGDSIIVRVVDVDPGGAQSGPLWTPADVSSMSLARSSAKETLHPVAPGMFAWDLVLEDLVSTDGGATWQLGPDALSPGEGVTLAYPEVGAWDPQMLYYPRSQNQDVSETFVFEHAIFPSESPGQYRSTARGYPAFTVTRLPLGGPDPTKKAVVFLHGVKGAQGYWGDGDGLPEAMEAMEYEPGKRYEVWEVSYPPVDRIRYAGFLVYHALRRIQELRGAADTQKASLHVVAHSMGGLAIRTVLQNVTSTPGLPGLSDPTRLIDRIVFLNSPHHGSHGANVLLGDAGLLCRGLANAINVLPGYNIWASDPATEDLSLGSPLTWLLNGSASSNLEAMSPDRVFSVVADTGRSIYPLPDPLYEKFPCDESPNESGSFDDFVVNEASANLKQDGGGDTQGFEAPAEIYPAWHNSVLTDHAAVGTVAGWIATFLKGASPGAPAVKQSDGIPLVRLRWQGTAEPVLETKVGGLGIRLTCGRASKQSSNGGMECVYHLWSSLGIGMDLNSGSYELNLYDSFNSWRNQNPVIPLGSLTIAPGGETSMRDVGPVDFTTAVRGFRAAASGTSTVEVVALSGDVGPTIDVEVTDPDGKKISLSQNDFGLGASYGLIDIDGNGLQDVLVHIASGVAGAYTVTWTTSSGVPPVARFAISAYAGQAKRTIVDNAAVYQNGSGSASFDLNFATPAGVTDLSMATGVGPGVIELGWSDPPGGGWEYDLRLSDSSMPDDGAFEGGDRVPVPASPSSQSHRVSLRVANEGVTYHARLRVISRNGYASALSNEASAPSGPGGAGLAADLTPPSVPVVADDGDATVTPGSLSFSWTSSDLESGIAAYRYALGSSPGATDVVGWTDAGTSAATTVASSNVVGGRNYYLTVVARNGEHLESSAGTSDGILVRDACSDDTHEPDDDSEHAVPLSPETPLFSNLCSDPDYLSIAVASGRSYTVSAYDLGAYAHPVLTVFDGSTFATLAQGGPTGPVSWISGVTGTAYVRVSTPDATYGAFREYSVRLLPSGDANADGETNVLDVFYLINALFAAGPSPQGPADVNADGKVDVLDVFYLINALFAGGVPPV
jgi:hypothetical protein